MGCCHNKYYIQETDNEIENNIRTTMNLLQINNISIKEFEQIFQNSIKISIQEVKDPKWYTEENFNKLLCSAIIYEKTESNFQYSYILKPSQEKKYAFHFFLQICYLLNGDIETKVDFIEKGLKAHQSPFTVKQMKIFIYNYLEVNLLKVTFSFIDSNKFLRKDEAIENLLKIYNERNLHDYCKTFIRGISKFILKTKPFLKENSTELDNEIFKSIDLYEYFLEYNILLDSFELRKNFYIKYSSNEDLNDKSVLIEEF